MAICVIQPTDLNLRHIEATAAVGRLGSITAAALAVNLSQPTLTQAVAKLERRLGHRLFGRHSDGVTATPAGTMFVGRIERAVARLSQTCRVVRRAARLAPLAYPERNMTMSQLRAFIGVERNGSYALAARELGLPSPRCTAPPASWRMSSARGCSSASVSVCAPRRRATGWPGVSGWRWWNCARGSTNWLR